MKYSGKLELTWVNKEKEMNIEPRILVEDKSKSYGNPNTENMLIHSDNLIALKASERDFAGKIKCIYIDPPYNTGSAFEHYDDNVEHSIWLSLMKQRLALLKELFREDGVIYIQIDDVEPIKETESVQLECKLFDDDELDRIETAAKASGVTSLADIDNVDVQNKLYEEYQKTYGPVSKPKKEKDDDGQMSLFEDFSEEESNITTETPKVEQKIKTKEEFVKKLKEYTTVAIQVPRIMMITSTNNKLNVFGVQRNIKDFDVEAAKIERFDAINQTLLDSTPAEILSDPNPVNTLACMLIDEVEELGSDDALFILDLVNGYLALIEGDDEHKKQVVRRYASLIINDIATQIRAYSTSTTNYTFKVLKDFICFRKINKTIKENGTLLFKRTFNDKTNIKKYIFEGYKRSYYPTNTFDSDSERVFSIILEEDDKVIRWIKPPLNQMGIFWRAAEQYNPDFLVETDSDKFMIEVKAKKDVKNPEVVEKAKVGIRWCEYASTCDPDKKKWHYYLVADEVIKEGNSLKYTLGLAESVEK